MDLSLVIPFLASAAAVGASIAKNMVAKKSMQSMVVITRPDGSTIRLEAEKTGQDELKKLVKQILEWDTESKDNGTTKT